MEAADLHMHQCSQLCGVQTLFACNYGDSYTLSILGDRLQHILPLQDEFLHLIIELDVGHFVDT